jgi:hypothetical protein
MEEIDGVIDAWNAEDQAVRRVTSSKTALARWLKQHCDIGHKADTIIRYIDERANGVA